METATVPGPTTTIHGGPGFDLHANQAPRILAISIALMVLSGLAVMLRFLSRMLSKAGLWWDDWVILTALIISWGPCVCMIFSMHWGFGQHIEVAGPNPNLAASHWFKIFYVFEAFYTTAMAITKYSIMLFYWRIFKTPHFKIALITVAVIVAAWLIAIDMAGFLEAFPVPDLWEVFVTGRPGQRISLPDYFIGSAVPNIILDWVLLMLPLPLVWGLKIPSSQKMGLTGIFLLGGFVCVVSIVRLVVLNRLQQVDITWSFVDAAIWSATEPTIGIVSACMPMMYPLIKAITSVPYNPTRAASRISGKGTITSSDETWPSPRSPQPETGGYSRYEEIPSPQTENSSQKARPRSPQNQYPPLGRDYPSPGNEGALPGIESPYGNHVTIYATRPLPHRGGSRASRDIGMEELAVPHNAERIRRDTSWLNVSAPTRYELDGHQHGGV